MNGSVLALEIVHKLRMMCFGRSFQEILNKIIESW